jgi:hypothetical protein
MNLRYEPDFSVGEAINKHPLIPLELSSITGGNMFEATGKNTSCKKSTNREAEK